MEAEADSGQAMTGFLEGLQLFTVTEIWTIAVFWGECHDLIYVLMKLF